MSALGLGKLVSDLLVVVQMLSGYGAPAEAPAVRFLPHAELQAMACGRPCAVFGWFPPGRTIYLDDRLNPADDVMARSILVHEMVHFLQQEAHGPSGPANCADWLEREREAFDVQIKWLSVQRARKRAYSPFGRAGFPVACQDDAASAATANTRPLAARP